MLTNKFEAMHSHISAPTQYKGRISEMLSQLRMRRHIDSQHQERYTVDPIAQDDIKSVSFILHKKYNVKIFVTYKILFLKKFRAFMIILEIIFNYKCCFGFILILS